MDQNFWMNPNRQATHMDRLLNDPRNPTILGEGSFQPTRETLPATPAGTTDEFIDGRWVPRDGMVPPPLRNRFSGQIDPATGGGQLQQYIGYEEEIPQTQRPARQTNKWPWGQSIANMFRGAMNQVIPPAY